MSPHSGSPRCAAVPDLPWYKRRRSLDPTLRSLYISPSVMRLYSFREHWFGPWDGLRILLLIVNVTGSLMALIDNLHILRTIV